MKTVSAPPVVRLRCEAGLVFGFCFLFGFASCGRRPLLFLVLLPASPHAITLTDHILAARARSAQFEVSEEALLQDVLFAFQGINGRHIGYSPMADAFVLSAAAGIPRSTRDLVAKLVELGWLFVRVRHYVDTCRSDRTFGLAGQAFCAALHHELTEFYRLMAALEGQTGAGANAGSLTLRRLVVWTHDPMLRMKTLASLVEHCAGLKGGALVSAIHQFSCHGDPYVQTLMKHILFTVAKPMFSMLHGWVYEGALHDAHNEFFVAQREDVPVDHIWQQKYDLRVAMLPAFIPRPLAERILIIGKSLDFLRHVCHDRESFNEAQMAARRLDSPQSDGSCKSLQISASISGHHLLLGVFLQLHAGPNQVARVREGMAMVSFLALTWLLIWQGLTWTTAAVWWPPSPRHTATQAAACWTSSLCGTASPDT